MIKFGTDGYRAIIGQDYTFDIVEKIAQAQADSLKERGGKKVVIGYDTRFMSEDFALSVAEVFSSNGFEVFVSKGNCTTPALSYAVKSLEADEGVMITASHNGYKYNGYKIKGSYGGPATVDIIKDVESRFGKSAVLNGKKDFQFLDLTSHYLQKIKSYFDYSIFKQKELKVIHDPMFATSIGLYNRLLEDTFIDVIQINHFKDPYFGGHHPEPIDKNLSLLKAKVIALESDLGIANDGDSDRVGIVSETGEFVSTQILYALLLLHTVRNRKFKGSIVKTVSTTYLADRIAQKEGLKIHKTPVGFKYVADIMLKETVAFGGEESGGYGFGFHIPERDGVLSGMLMLEMLMLYGKPLNEIIKDLFKEFGEAHYKREDLKVEGSQGLDLVKSFKEKDVKEFAGLRVKEKDTTDGVKLIFEDDSWLLLRASGTEPVLRIYAETPSLKTTEKLINEAKKLI
ncbi:phosphoglucomutase/phosphomannomutase family protein [Sulfurihydrogenibium subterraneum]|uniref:phosphoglucomutase/phosphomannomutase family protein n=1 Tax=Sulfurihydrogenibium subterraneum TaxID=171121 RepID=UPI0004918E07|nr:phosphoglucomutase/phosphomannomutase family protein [Sulfurihydrogenibium subterraneum]